jgi:hypothetical protein
MDFDGETYDPARDEVRLTGQLRAVRRFMSDHEWHNLKELVYAVGGTEASVSARLRDLRKDKFGAYRVQRKYAFHGVWLYRLLPSTPRVVGSDPNLVYDPEAISMVPIKGWRAGA